MRCSLERTHRTILLVVAVSVLTVSCGNDKTNSTSSPPSNPTPANTPIKDSEPAVSQPSKTPHRIEGHRGARGLKPESTMPAFETALDLGVTALEFDLHLSADNQIVVWHDPSFGTDKCRFADRVNTGQDYPSEGISVASVTAEQLADYVCDLNPDPGRFPNQDNGPTALAQANYGPATLAEVLEFVAAYADSPDKTDEQRANAAKVEFNIETKREPNNPATIGDDFNGVDPGRFELEILAVIKAAGVADRVIIQSFDHRSLWAIRSVDEDVRLSALTTGEKPDFAELAAKGANIWSPSYQVLSKSLIDEAHEAGLLVLPWTVNEVSDMSDLFEMGVDGLITDRPDIGIGLP